MTDLRKRWRVTRENETLFYVAVAAIALVFAAFATVGVLLLIKYFLMPWLLN